MTGWVLAWCVAAGASAGAVLRWLLSGWFGATLGILLANAVGAFLIGLLAPMLSDPRAQALLLTGFLGGLTTFSSFSLEVVMLLQHGRLGQAALLMVVHLGLSLMLTALGLALASWLLAK